MKTWRERCKPIIAEVIAKNKGKTEKDIRQALSEAYPFGQRKHYPYKVWLDEIKVQMNNKPSKNYVNPNQGKLF